MKVTRTINVLAVLTLIGAAVSVYKIKYEATWQAVEVERLTRQIEREKVSINILKAEWAHLVRPDRIQNLAEKHLDLKPADSKQLMAALADLPLRPAKVDSIADTIASLGGIEMPITDEPKRPGEDPIARTIESMGLAMPTADDRIERTMRELGMGGVQNFGPPQ